MRDVELDRIRAVAERYRSALESTPFGDRDGSLTDFPERCCHHASFLLLCHFGQLGIEGFAIYQGTSPEDESQKHQWLQKGDLVVDITADQFLRHGLPSVVVTHDSAWHRARRGRRLPYDETSVLETGTWYDDRGIVERIIAHLPPENTT